MFMFFILSYTHSYVHLQNAKLFVTDFHKVRRKDRIYTILYCDRTKTIPISKTLSKWILCKRQCYVFIKFYFNSLFLKRPHFPCSLAAKWRSSVATRPGQKTTCTIHLHSLFWPPRQSWKSCALSGLATCDGRNLDAEIATWTTSQVSHPIMSVCDLKK